MKFTIVIFLSFAYFPVIRAQNGGGSGGGSGGGVKFEIFHVDLVPLTSAYGASELIFEQTMESTMDRIIKAQAVTDSMFYKMVILEEKTQEYQRNLQAHLLRSLNGDYIQDMIGMIQDNQTWMDVYAGNYPEYRELVDDSKKYVVGRAKEIRRYIDNVSMKTGNEGRLDNKQRNDLNLYVIGELKKLCYVSQGLRRMLGVAHPQQNSNLKIPVKKD
ncbi:MAG: hypothetical protein LBJ72_10370 [Dysgonamonadaceae bacterium]|jgi:hypothetical protein|nr:hypothetical protein [Dysgonamonadaceae bacterium]